MFVAEKVPLLLVISLTANDLAILSSSVRSLKKMVGICEEFANDHSVTFNSGRISCMCLGRMPEYPQPQIYLNGMILQWVKNARHLGNIVTPQVKDDMGIQLKPGQFNGAVNSLCEKFGGIPWQKAIRRIFNLPYNTHRCVLPFVAGSSHIRLNLVTDLTIYWMHWCLVTTRSLSFWCTTAISVILQWVSIEKSWICTFVIHAIKSKKLMVHCFCHYWMFDAQIGMSPIFRTMILNVWFMMIVSINLDIWWWCIFLMSEYLLFHARLSCMNDWLLWYLYLFTLTCSSFFVYCDLLNPDKLLDWIELLPKVF